jgi:formamidopyrimidine-DNA glycosylase
MFGGGGHSLSPTDTHLPNRHTRISFTLDNGMQLFFNDMRLFGYVKIADTAEVEAARSKFGPEPITDDFDVEYFYKGSQAPEDSCQSSTPRSIIRRWPR